MNEVRVGKISSVNYEKYRAAVVYASNEKTDPVTVDFPFLMDFLIKPPQVGDQVYVLHLSGAQENGLILGRAGSDKLTPEECAEGLCRLHLSREQDVCYFRYDGGGDGKLLLHNDGDFRAEAKNIAVEADADLSVKSDATLEINGGSGVAVKGAKVDLSPGGTVTIAPGGTVTVTASSVVINGVNFSTHTHAWLATPAPGSPGVTLGPNVTGG